jgi:endo-1,4-beta-D-glucanase Y
LRTPQPTAPGLSPDTTPIPAERQQNSPDGHGPIGGSEPPQRVRTRPARTRWGARGAIAALILAGAVGLANSGSWFPREPDPEPPASGTSADAAATPEEALQSASQGFLSAWVDPDGRVVRRDQGGDTVSEGQAYGMLIALAVGDEEKFTSIWAWTEQNLLTPDGLLAWRWQDGAVVDQGPAADADVDVARALVLAGSTFDRPELTEAGNALAGRVMDRLSVPTTAGRILLPGLWTAEGPDHIYNPSYASPAAFSILAESTGDPRWTEVAAGSLAVSDALLQKSPLPPDWAQVRADGVVTAMPGPAGLGPEVRYSYDATRFPIRFAESCIAAEREFAGRLAPTLNASDPLLTTLDLGGTAMGSDQNPIAYVARASARAVAGNTSGSRADLARADDMNALYPSYYGAAWTALGHILLDSPVLGGCPALGQK